MPMVRWSQSLRSGNRTTAGPTAGRGGRGWWTRLDRVAHRAQDLADLAAQEDEGHDRDDRDEREDQRVLRETLAILVAADEFHYAKIQIVEERHSGCLLDEYSPPVEGCATIGRLFLHRH